MKSDTTHALSSPYRGVIDRYRQFLPVSEKTPVITLREGNTPLIRAFSLEKLIAGSRVYLKYEGLNPTGSFKDRGMTLAISKAVEAGHKAVICASTGNTSASAAAYASRASIVCAVLIPDNAIALGKLAQALIYGAKVIALKGNFDQALSLVKEISSKYPYTLVNSLNEHRIEGQKTSAFEICDELGDAPDYLFIPVGNAGNITAYWRGFREYHSKGHSTRLPRMMGFQAEGAAPIVRGHVVEKPETRATAIRIGNPARWEEAAAAGKDSGGVIDMVSEKEIFDAYKLLATSEGVFVEPASAASVAGLLRYAREGKIPEGSTIVCVNTGHGLKDPDAAIKESAAPAVCPDSLEKVLEALAK
ncbi:MAG: threonine synthase [Candidatus Eremiobacteraeota bacterium]|nr:threonine synthase [Candidatus Eremiobacteraeota bacterium]